MTNQTLDLRRQPLALLGDRAEAEILNWMDEVADTQGWSAAPPLHRHPREGGDPADSGASSEDLDPRLRGDDGQKSV